MLELLVVLRMLSALLALYAMLNGAAHAIESPDPVTALRRVLEKETKGLPGRVEIVIGKQDSSLNLSPCLKVEATLPPGVRPWGRFTARVRCAQTPGWNIYLPVEVKVWGPALVAVASLSTGQSPGREDVRTEEIELTRESGAITTTAQLSDKMLVRPVSAGQVLRHEQFRARPLVSQGDMVKVVYRGSGFMVSTEGHALGQAMAGQTLRVQTESGRVLSGQLQAGRVVEVAF
jgi:flagella basal body P-ring formation protein FlgA